MPTPNDRGPRRPRTNTSYHMEGDWAVPDREQAAPPPQRRTPTQEQRRAAARSRRELRRRRRRLAFAGTVCGILVLSGVITAVLPKSAKGEPETPAATAEPSSTRLVALPEFGRVDTSWFADAAFLGDSLTAGFCVNEYNIDVGGALVCGYEGISPNTIVNRTTVSSPDRGEEVPLDVLTAAQPAKLYILIGTNALVQPGNDDSFLAYYGKMLDELRTALPNTAFYVQSVLPATQEKISDTLPGLAPDRLAVINAAIQQLCAERGCYYLDLNAEFADDAGCLMTDFAQPDGVHLTVSGYSRWVSYLCTHLPYSKNNPYQAGSTYYLSEDMKTLLADIP